jgi:hypothetical protein
MDRQKHPQLDAAVSIHRNEETRRHHVAIRIRNVSRVMAKNYAIRLLFPLRINSERVRPTEKTPLLSGEDGSWVWDIRFDNSGGGPLFPSDEVVRVAEFERIDSLRPERDSTITEIRLTILPTRCSRCSSLKTCPQLMKAGHKHRQGDLNKIGDATTP